MSASHLKSPPPLRIFVVENHADTLKYLRLYLEHLNHVVESARTMTDALAVLAREKFDVLISDIGLPDGDGWELLRRAGPSRPAYAIAMSGFGMNADRTKSRAAGFRNHMLKPFIPDDLDRSLKEASVERDRAAVESADRKPETGEAADGAGARGALFPSKK